LIFCIKLKTILYLAGQFFHWLILHSLSLYLQYLRKSFKNNSSLSSFSPIILTQIIFQAADKVIWTSIDSHQLNNFIYVISLYQWSQDVSLRTWQINKLLQQSQHGISFLKILCLDHTFTLFHISCNTSMHHSITSYFKLF